jgi:hypothetical protein
MGASLAVRVYKEWAELPDKPFRLLVGIALTIKDHDQDPSYWGGRDAMCLFLGLPVGEAASYQTVTRTVRVLVNAGALERLYFGHAGARSKYRLKFIHRVSSSDTQRVSSGDMHRVSIRDSKGYQIQPERVSPGDTPRNKEEQKQERKEENQSSSKVTLPSRRVAAARSTPERMLALVEAIDRGAS